MERYLRLNPVKEGQTQDSVQEIIQEMDYSFDHPQITEHEIVDIMDTQVDESSDEDYIDLFDNKGHSDE